MGEIPVGQLQNSMGCRFITIDFSFNPGHYGKAFPVKIVYLYLLIGKTNKYFSQLFQHILFN